jgi:hypothetical protein
VRRFKKTDNTQALIWRTERALYAIRKMLSRSPATASRTRSLRLSFPISAFVAAGFEHRVANMYVIPLGILLSAGAAPSAAAPDWWGFASNLVPVTLGNVVGGTSYRRGLRHL